MPFSIIDTIVFFQRISNLKLYFAYTKQSTKWNNLILNAQNIAYDLSTTFKKHIDSTVIRCSGSNDNIFERYTKKCRPSLLILPDDVLPTNLQQLYA